MGALLIKLYKNLGVVLSACFLSITVGVVILNVILRYVFDGGLFWVEEVATTAFIWSVFIGSAAAYKRKMHIGIDLITKLFPERVREIISSIINLLMAVVNGYVCYLSILMINANKLKRTPVLDIPAMYINLAITVGFGLMTLHSIQFLVTEGILLFKGRKDLPRNSL
jgi:TRAP-type C4-dicarboxylate transport system permease small subunit